MKTRDQVRAERASALVASVKNEQVDEYLGGLRELPMLVVNNGLGPTLAFLKARGDAVKAALYEHIGAWVSEAVYGEQKGDLLSLVIANPASKLMRAQEEALVFVMWLRRFAEARDSKARKS